MANSQHGPRKKKNIKDLTNRMKIEMTTPQEDTTLQALEATQEEL
jgi:hypothetical protein